MSFSAGSLMRNRYFVRAMPRPAPTEKLRELSLPKSTRPLNIAEVLDVLPSASMLVKMSLLVTARAE
jgi:hypothetical protein